MEHEQQEMSIKDYMTVMKRRRWHFFIPFAVILLVAVVTALVLPPVYRSDSTILIEEQEIPPDYVMSTVTGYAEQRLQVINQRVMSTSQLLDIIKRFNLYSEYAGKWTTEEMVEQMRDDIDLEFINADVVDKHTGRPSSVTIAFNLSYEGKESPQTVQNVANVLASLFLEENRKVRQKQVTETAQFFEQEIEKLKKDVSKKTAALADFKERHVDELPEVLQVNMQSLNNNEVSAQRLDEQLRSLREKAEYYESQLANTSPKLEDLKKSTDEQQLEQLRVDLVSLQARYSDQYPDVIKTKAEIKELEARVAADKKKAPALDSATGEVPDNPAYVSLASQLAGVRSEIQSVLNQKKEFEAKADMYRRRVAATPEVERQYKALTNDLTATQAKIADLTNKLLESKVAEGLESEQKGERFTIIDPARLPEEPYKPNRLAIVLIGCVLAVGAGVGIAALAEFADHAVYRPTDLTEATGFPVLAVIPDLVTEEEKAARRRRKWLLFAALAVALGVGLLLIHLFVMDFSVLMAKIQRHLG